MTNINVNINEINNSQLQTGQQLPSHQLNTNLTNCNIPQNYIDTTQEDTCFGINGKFIGSLS
jgi:type 1 fimbria pilin